MPANPPNSLKFSGIRSCSYCLPYNVPRPTPGCRCSRHLLHDSESPPEQLPWSDHRPPRRRKYSTHVRAYARTVVASSWCTPTRHFLICTFHMISPSLGLESLSWGWNLRATRSRLYSTDTVSSTPLLRSVTPSLLILFRHVRPSPFPPPTAVQYRHSATSALSPTGRDVRSKVADGQRERSGGFQDMLHWGWICWWPHHGNDRQALPHGAGYSGGP